MKAVYISITEDDTVELATPLEVEGYGVCVIEMNGRVQNGFKDSLYLCCDICEESYVNNTKMPILRRIN